MDVSARSDAGTSLRFDVLEPSIASVTVVDVGEVSHEVDIQFLDEGTTELFVIADDGTVLDAQTLRVRAPVSAELTPWEELQATRSSGRPVVPRRPGTLHTVQGAFVDLALT